MKITLDKSDMTSGHVTAEISLNLNEIWSRAHTWEVWEPLCTALDEQGLPRTFEGFMQLLPLMGPHNDRYFGLVSQIVSDAAEEWNGHDTYGPYLDRVHRLLAKHTSVDGAKNPEFNDQAATIMRLIESKLDSMDLYSYVAQELPADFALGYLIGQMTPAIQAEGHTASWGEFSGLTDAVVQSLDRHVSSSRAKKRHGWTEDMARWLHEQIQDIPRKADGRLKPSNRRAALKLCPAAISYRAEKYPPGWADKQAAFEWVYKTINKITTNMR